MFQILVLTGRTFGVLGYHRGNVEIALAAEVAGDEGGVHAGLLADLPDRRAFEPLLAEEGLRRLEQRILARRGVPGSTGLGLPLAPCRRVPHGHVLSSWGPE